MELSNTDPDSISKYKDTSKLMIDKSVVISALQKLIDDYPSDVIPYNVVRQALVQIMGSSAFGDLSKHPAMSKLDQTLMKAKTITNI